MDSSAKIMKATGIIHMIHGSIMGILFLIILLATSSMMSVFGGLLFLSISIGISFLYIYIGYELYSLRSSDKMRNLLIVSIILSCIEIVISMVKGETAGVLFIIEFIMSIVAICNIDSYKEYKKNIGQKKEKISSVYKQENDSHKGNSLEDDYEDDF